MDRYFVSDVAPSSSGLGRYWREVQQFSGFTTPGTTYDGVFAAGSSTNGGHFFHANLNLLAHAVGDDAGDHLVGRATLVRKFPYEVKNRVAVAGASTKLTVEVQPWEENHRAPRGGSNRVRLAIGANLAAFLDDPLGLGHGLELGLPFTDPDATPSGGWVRPPKKPSDPGSAFHGGIDFSVPTDPRPLLTAAAAADGTVLYLLNGKRSSGHQGGVALLHEPAPGKQFITIYQHLQPDSVKLAVGDVVSRGDRLGKIRRWINDDGSDNSHLHFSVAVPGPAFDLDGTPVPALWYFIDPFGVYGYHDHSSTSDYEYVPRAAGGMAYRIRGADRTIHWAANPPIRMLPAEIQTRPAPIREVQTRVLRKRGGAGDALPAERNQFLVWLAGTPGFFSLPLAAPPRAIERETVALLERACTEGRPVLLGYRWVGGDRRISAVWVQR